jgi:hypothetical protein
LVEAVVPFMGESVTDGTLANFLKSMRLADDMLSFSEPGDRVEADEPIAQIETDKVIYFSYKLVLYYCMIYFWNFTELKISPLVFRLQ